jgi:hypothetical protein
LWRFGHGVVLGEVLDGVLGVALGVASGDVLGVQNWSLNRGLVNSCWSMVCGAYLYSLYDWVQVCVSLGPVAHVRSAGVDHSSSFQKHAATQQSVVGG